MMNRSKKHAAVIGSTIPANPNRKLLAINRPGSSFRRFRKAPTDNRMMANVANTKKGILPTQSIVRMNESADGGVEARVETKIQLETIEQRKNTRNHRTGAIRIMKCPFGQYGTPRQ
jgi:hypothetical protein